MGRRAGVRTRPGGVLVVVAIVLALAVPLLTGDAGASDEPAHWQQAPIASWRIDGVGNTTLVVGDTVYVGGDFATVRSLDGSQVVNRANLAAFDLRTGALRPSFQANTNGIVRSLAVSGGQLFVGGSFTSVRGVARGRLAAVDLATGAVSTTFAADTNSNVYALAVGGGRLFVGGSFSSVRGVARARVAALDPTTGALSSYAPNPNGTVLSLAATPTGDRVFVGGTFSLAASVASPWLVKTDATGAAIATTWSDLQGPPLDLEVNSDGTRLAVAQAGAGNQGTWYNATTGARLWRQRCDGDGQAIHIVDGTVLTGFHEACDGDTTQRLTANDTANGARDLAFKPAFDRFYGVWGIDGDADNLVIAGDFTTISGVRVQGFAIFPSRVVSPPPVALSGAATWRYLVTPAAPPSGWNQPGFADGSWPAGGAQLGYGDGDEVTEVGYGPNAAAKYLTTYFRTTFTARAVPDTLTLSLLADDGAAVYVNGIEVARDNLPPGPLTATTRASSGRSGAAEATLRAFSIPPGAVHVGSNTIAVEVHQDNGATSDLSFAAALTSTGTVPTATTTTSAPTTTTVAPTTTTTAPPATAVPTTAAPSTALFRGEFTAANATAWPGWTTGAASGSATVQGNAGQLAISDTANAYVRAQLTGLAARADGQVRFSYRWSGTGPVAYLNVYSRGSGGWANAYRPREGYGVELASNSSAVVVRRASGGTVSTVRTLGAGQAVTTQKQWMALRVVGGTIQFKTWLDGAPEPVAFTSTDADPTVKAPGHLFVSVVRGGSNRGAKSVTIDDLTVLAN